MADQPKQPEPVKQLLWTFYYHKGPAPKYGNVEARDERIALQVATRWCVLNGCRPPASVQPFVLATEDILKTPEPGPEPELVDAIAATTAVAG